MGDKPPALSPELRAMLGTYREAQAMPADAKARVQDRLRTTDERRPIWLWASVGAVAAALLLWAGVASMLGSTQTSAESDPGSQAAMQATASDGETAVAAQPPEPGAAPFRSPVGREIEPVPLEPGPESFDPEPEPSREPVPEPLPEPGARKKPRRPKSAAAPEPEPQPVEIVPQTPASRLGAENRLIAKTWEHLRANRYAQAKASLHEHASAFPHGVLAPERRALQVIVDCLANPQAAAGKAQAYAASGRSTLLAKVRSACNEEKSAGK